MPFVTRLTTQHRALGTTGLTPAHQLKRGCRRLKTLMTNRDHVKIKNRIVADRICRICWGVKANRMLHRIDALDIPSEVTPRSIVIARFAANNPDNRISTVAGDNVTPVSLEAIQTNLLQRTPATCLRSTPTADNYRNDSVVYQVSNASVSVSEVRRVDLGKILRQIG